MSERDITVNGTTFVCRVDGGEVRVGRRTDTDIDWYESAVPLDLLPGGLDDDIALRGIITAIIDRGA